MRKAICIILSMLLLISITGCYAQNTTVVSNKVPITTACSHSYSDATCLQASKCTKCGKTNGGLGSHSYVDGVCTLCEEEDPAWEPPVLTGSEYDRINGLMEGRYQFRTDAGILVEYNFADGEFTCYTQLGGSILENNGTYILTEKTLVLYYQNGTVKDCRWKLNDEGMVELFLLELT